MKHIKISQNRFQNNNNHPDIIEKIMMCKIQTKDQIRKICKDFVMCLFIFISYVHTRIYINIFIYMTYKRMNFEKWLYAYDDDDVLDLFSRSLFDVLHTVV